VGRRGKRTKMTDASERERGLAERLLVGEAGTDQSAEELAGAVERCFGRLRQGLIDLIGAAGFDVLVQRALFLAGKTHPFLKGIVVEVRSDVLRLEGLRAAVAGQDPTIVRDGLVSALASFFSLLVTFIGEDLAFRLIRRAWPTMPPEKTDSVEEGDHP